MSDLGLVLLCPTVQSWASHLNSVSLYFLICKIRQIICTLQIYSEEYTNSFM